MCRIRVLHETDRLSIGALPGDSGALGARSSLSTGSRSAGPRRRVAGFSGHLEGVVWGEKGFVPGSKIFSVTFLK
jgi:hypothetical protein